jgi:hypothetical protein
MAERLANVFVVEARGDQERVDRVLDALRDADLPLVSQRMLAPGSDWSDEVDSYFAMAYAVLVAWSSNTGADEVDLAARAGDRLVSIGLDGMSSVPERFAARAALDLEGWDGDPEDGRIRDLVGILGNLAWEDRGAKPSPPVASDEQQVAAEVDADVTKHSTPVAGDPGTTGDGATLSDTATQATSLACALAEQRSSPSASGAARVDVPVILLAALLRAGQGGVTRAFLDILGEKNTPADGPTVIEKLADELGVPRTALPAGAAEARGDVDRTEIDRVVRRAATIAERTQSGPPVRLRHLLAAVVTDAGLAAAPSALPGPQRDLVADLGQAVRAAVPDAGDRWDAVLVAPPGALAGGISADRVDPDVGIPIEFDSLGVAPYASMFAALVVDEKTPMPLSIGLFGSWGSGKSTFMGLMRNQVDTQARQPGNLHRVAQIGFNAWHYSDANLWASLGDEIFEQLTQPRADGTEQLRSDTQRALAETLARRRQLESAKQHATEEVVRLNTEIAKARSQKRVGVRDLYKTITSGSYEEDAKKAFRRLGVSDEVEKSVLLAREVQSLSAERETIRAITRTRLTRTATVTLALVALALLASLIFPSVRKFFFGAGWVALVAGLGYAEVVVRRIRSGVQLLGDVATKARADMSDELVQKVTDLQRAEAAERISATQLREVNDRIAELGRELVELSPGQQMYRFLSERAASRDYVGQLGLISTVRKDFEQLVKLVKAVRNDEESDGPQRIVLYIDDLDRCTPAQVVSVLQAVNLLLAQELFVVVVGVDPRWLVRSLQREYHRILSTNGDGRSETVWDATPEDYLAKIFNIPFVLPAMVDTTFTRLLQDLARERPADGSGTQPAHDDGTTSAEPSATPAETPLPSVEPDSLLSPEAGSQVERALAGDADVEATPLTPEEIATLSRLAPLVETPREAKRLLNLYRILRSSRNVSSSSDFLGSDGNIGEFHALVTVLGLLSTEPDVLRDLLSAPATADVAGGLFSRGSGNWAAFIADVAPTENEARWSNHIVGQLDDERVDDWRRIADGLSHAAEGADALELEVFKTWAREIARFSFVLSPLSMGTGAATSAAPPQPGVASRP